MTDRSLSYLAIAVATAAMATIWVVLLVSPCRAEDAATFLQNLPKPNMQEIEKKWPAPPLTRDERLGRPSTRQLTQCWDEVDLSGNAKRDPFDEEAVFSCMLQKGYRFCGNCASSQKVFCKRNRWAPRDHECWESTTFPEPHPRAEMP
jgi:hypothetical protein